MKALGLMAFGGPDVLEPIDVPLPEPTAGEVRIRVHAASINHADVSLRSGGGFARLMGDRQPPFIPGLDAAGIVDEVGPDVDDRLSVGDRVVAFVSPMNRYGGAYAEYVAVPAASVVRAPSNVSLAAAATLLVNAATARLALDLFDLPPGSSVAITGAAGAVGGYAIQLAKADGLRVIAQAASEDDELVRALGADVVVPRGTTLAQAVRSDTPDGVDALLDAACLGAPALSAIRDHGALAAVRPWDGPSEREIVIHQINAMTRSADPAELERLCQYVDDGILTLRVAEIMPSSRASAAHKRFEAGGVRGRLVLDFSPSGRE